MKNNYKQFGYYFSFILLLFVMGSCTKMNETYHDFWKDGQRTYPASPDSLEVFSGRNRVRLQWLNIGDPTLSKAVIYWNNHSDSLVVPIEKSEDGDNDTVTVLIDPLAEGAYSFDIYTYDKYGNISVVANAIGKVYGDTYAKSLLTRLINNNSLLDDTLRIQWGDPADKTSIGTEVVYVDKQGNERHRIIAPDADTTMILDYDHHASKYFAYRTLFLPDSMSIDTFYTAYDSVRVLGPRENLPVTGWSGTASSHDQRYDPPAYTGSKAARFPMAALDNNTATAWINSISPNQTVYPHSYTLDMKEVRSDIYGISFYLNKRAECPRSMNVSVSDNGTDWRPLGLIDIANQTGWQYFDFSEPQSFQYLKMVFENSYGSDNIVIYEIRVYTR